jgi:type IV secretory pathway TraG/TraD family ATPase VirD4
MIHKEIRPGRSFKPNSPKLVRRVTGSTTINLDALIASEPMTLYIIVPPARLTAYKPLLRAWLSGLL